MATAIILCGGQGKRLRPLTDTIPKCMVPLNGKPLIEYQLVLLKRHKIDKIILACGYKWEAIKERYGNKFIYSVEDRPLGTGGALKKAIDLVEEDEFFVTDCDEITDLDLSAMKSIGSNVIAVSRFKCRFGIVELEGNRVKSFKQKPVLKDIWASMGMYYLNREIKDKLPDEGSLERVLFQDPNFKLKAYRHNGFWLTVNTRKDKEEAEKFLKEHDIF